MSAEFRIIHFITDAFSGGRWPVAAMLRENRDVTVVIATLLPCAGCLGGEPRAATLRMVLDSLADHRIFDTLPVAVRPLVTLAERMDIPRGVADAAAWLRAHVLPRAVAVTPAAQPARSGW